MSTSSNGQFGEIGRGQRQLEWKGIDPYWERPFQPNTPQRPPLFWSQGATIISSLDTMHIMNLTAEYQQGMKWVNEKFNFKDLVEIFVNHSTIFQYFYNFFLFIGRAIFPR